MNAQGAYTTEGGRKKINYEIMTKLLELISSPAYACVFIQKRKGIWFIRSKNNVPAVLFIRTNDSNA